MRLIEPTEGIIRFVGQDIFGMDKNSVRKMRQEMAMVFQDPSSALDPKMTVKDLIGEPLRLHDLKRDEIQRKVIESMELVNLPHSYLDRHAHELSGGEKQRVGIARALITKPKLVIADEPTSALDVSIQAQILELMKELVKKLGVTLVFISHDLAIVKYICNDVAVMYLGKILELGGTKQVLKTPLHPYTKALYSSVPEPDLTIREKILLKGSPSSSGEELHGCKFSPRCPVAKKECASEAPELMEVRPGHFVACDLEELESK
jgi:oligopeptide/dipeptide ABC transporter ATP-binding protein